MEGSRHEQQKQSLSDLIPVIDLAALNGDHIDEFERRRIITEIAHACKTWGAFQLVNHGIQPHVIERARAKACGVFELPNETRWKAKRSPGSLSGYGNGAVIADAVNNEIASEAITFGYPNSEADVIASIFWPRGNPGFSASIDDYNEESHELALKVVRLMVEGLELHGNLAHFQPYLTEHFGVLRINNYPASEHPTRDIGLPPHIDDTLLTIVHQGCEVEGLQVKKDGQWVTVPPRGDVMVVLVAAVCQVITNDNYKAVLHRAVPNRDKARLSMVYSAYPPANIFITAAPEFVSPAHPPLYKPFTWSEYLSGQVTHILNPIDGLQTVEREGETQNQTSESSESSSKLD
ncbi:gibberellin 3-beta-dioxygenase 1 isoform X2 [Physcomitrium patens]|nr:gibberellin 3-beta-dioxygenase 1-like isoform X2 [Physcomitrium patens]XP_024401397.1 gibberellin 3-beta-dioxygenase 1-like isoform X2 [Physcomitrium patens]XP_024401399.1 gibberellin 3-beta-dioxygenase 1-like isoform X2 [Physcomitrium patens]PNR36575.1 hypothetical protein PHYPA_022426 [Physcomitrium patens]|eukprot:XP_024401396.1 gibberellin 3-beta-dioxygenase 1-like isoform X2 [Physcomitrella patens]